MQFKLMLDEEVVNDLDECAKRYGRKTANQVAVEIITLYLPLWKSSAEAQFDVIKEQQGKALQGKDGAIPIRKANDNAKQPNKKNRAS